MTARYTLAFMMPALIAGTTLAQCDMGQSEVHIQVITDDWGYETYWELLPSGASCGDGTIFSGGNAAVGCDGAGAQMQPSGGYANNATIMEGPFCLNDGALYDIFWADDWGDNGATFNVMVNGEHTAQFIGLGDSSVFTFMAGPPTARDMRIEHSRVPLFARVGQPVVIRGDVHTLGTAQVNSFDINYSVNDGAPSVTAITGVGLEQFTSFTYEHEVPWVPDQDGAMVVKVWAGNINGEQDQASWNDTTTTVVRTQWIPNIIDHYFDGAPEVDVIADDDQDILVPRDLDFHPDPDRDELWIINKDVESSGGSTVRLFGAGEEGMTWLWQRDHNAWHFMSLPTAIAFADNNNFATCPGVFDANHNGSPPFTGPTLWDSDTAVYAQNSFGPLGSHIDMVHANPESQGITHDHWNRFWLVDGYNGDITMNDFRMDHGPGMDDHNDAIIRRYADFTITKDPNDHIVSHCVLDKSTGWLYVVDHGGDRVLRMDINTGTVSGPGNFTVYENYDEYSMVTGYTWEVVVDEGLVEPAGIDIIDDRLLVSDHATGEIIVYDLSEPAASEIGRIATGSPGIMGITIGPDGRIWYVNATLHQVGRISPALFTGITEAAPQSGFNVFPVPADHTIVVPVSEGLSPDELVEMHDVMGRSIGTYRISDLNRGLDIADLPNGTYTLRTMGNSNSRIARFVVRH